MEKCENTNDDGETRVVLGQGILAWTRGERVGDRYGAVYVDATPAGDSDPDDGAYSVMDYETINEMAGTVGTLRATVLEGRESGHIGDLFHGLAQTEVPDEGDEYELGTGRLFVATDEYGTSADYPNPVGIDPEDGSEEFWLDPEVLYDLHDSVVELEFEPTDG